MTFGPIFGTQGMAVFLVLLLLLLLLVPRVLFFFYQLSINYQAVRLIFVFPRPACFKASVCDAEGAFV